MQQCHYGVNIIDFFLFTHLGDFKDYLPIAICRQKLEISHYCILFPSFSNLSFLLFHPPVSLPQTEKRKTLSFHLPHVHAVTWWCVCLFESLSVPCFPFPSLVVGVEPDDRSPDACPPKTEICQLTKAKEKQSIFYNNTSFVFPLHFVILRTKRVLILTPEELQTIAVNTEYCFCI